LRGKKESSGRYADASLSKRTPFRALHLRVDMAVHNIVIGRASARMTTAPTKNIRRSRHAKAHLDRGSRVRSTTSKAIGAATSRSGDRVARAEARMPGRWREPEMSCPANESGRVAARTGHAGGCFWPIDCCVKAPGGKLRLWRVRAPEACCSCAFFICAATCRLARRPWWIFRSSPKYFGKLRREPRTISLFLVR